MGRAQSWPIGPIGSIWVSKAVGLATLLSHVEALKEAERR
jgi:hypothetical protein